VRGKPPRAGPRRAEKATVGRSVKRWFEVGEEGYMATGHGEQPESARGRVESATIFPRSGSLRRPVGASALASLVVLLLGMAAHAQSPPRGRDQPTGLTIRAPHAIVMDASSGAVLAQKDADTLRPPASMSKLMTLAVVFRALKEGKLQPGDEFKMSVNAWRTGGAPSRTAAMFVPVNSKVTLAELLQGVIVQSGNDAAIALAEGIAGSEPAFAKLMEAEARRIGLAHSTFRNATGLPHPEHLMSVRELAMLARHLILTYPEYYPQFSQREFRYRRYRFINRNPLLGENGVDGMKTGHLQVAGYGLVASAKQGERRLIVVVAGLKTPPQRKTEAARILDWGFRNSGDFRIFDAGEVVGSARVWGGTRMFLPLVGNGEISIVLPRFPSNQRLRGEIVYNSPLKPPIRRGDRVATLRVTSTSRAQNEVPLYAAEDVEPGGLVRRGLDSLLHLGTRWLP
jgi:D-alanyl-D-alanine carboxypeptidase (penicillin-binding protein 5/6)